MDGRRVALLVGIDDFGDPGLSRLTAPTQDVDRLASVLRSAKIGAFDEVIVVRNEPSHVVALAIQEFFAQRRRDDMLVFYFSGHGLKDIGGRLYLAMTNTRPDRLASTALAAPFLHDEMERSLSRRQVVILDCCYGGAFAQGFTSKSDNRVHAPERFKGRGRVVLTSSDSTQFAFEGDQVSGQPVGSVFTRHLVEGLESGEADRDTDGEVSLDELYDHVYERVIDTLPGQRPSKSQWGVEGRLVIARNPHWRIPAHLEQLITSSAPDGRAAAVDALAGMLHLQNSAVVAVARDRLESLAGDGSRLVADPALLALERVLPAPDSVPAPEPAGPIVGTGPDRGGDGAGDLVGSAPRPAETSIDQGNEVAVLHFTTPGQRPRARQLGVGRQTIGRGSDCDVSIADLYVSLRHAQIDVTSEGAWITDLGSSNGTFVGTTPVRGSRWLTFPSEVRVGKTFIWITGTPPSQSEASASRPDDRSPPPPSADPTDSPHSARSRPPPPRRAEGDTAKATPPRPVPTNLIHRPVA